MANSNPYTRLLERNKSKLEKIMICNRRIKAIFSALEKDTLPETATQRFKDARKKQISECKLLISKHENFKDAEKTQKSIDSIHELMIDFLKPYSKLGL